MTNKQTPDRKPQSSKDKAGASKKPEKKDAAKTAAKAAAKPEAKPKPTDLKSILKAMIKPLPVPKPKPAKVAGSQANGSGADLAKSTNSSGKQMAKPPSTAAAGTKVPQRPMAQTGKQAVVKVQIPA